MGEGDLRRRIGIGGLGELAVVDIVVSGAQIVGNYLAIWKGQAD